MNIIKITGKYLDQPLLVAKFNKIFPVALVAGGTLFTAHNVKHVPKEEKRNTAIKNSIIMGATVASALVAPKLANKVFKNKINTIISVKEKNTQLVDKFLELNNVDNVSSNILKKSKEHVLGFKEVKYIHNKLGKTKQGQEFLNELIPNPENISSKDIFSEIGRLSFLGFIPVVGGILGGVLGDRVTNSDWQSRFPNKIKEGLYQYLANIFLCNVGAGIALGIMEKIGIKSKSGRALGMITGIIATGVVGGSIIANIISNKIVNPLFGEKSRKGIYNERKPEALDVGLHVDDIATVAVMSGLKWIEPALPIMYSISGYRAGIGYRNNNVNNCNKITNV